MIDVDEEMEFNRASNSTINQIQMGAYTEKWRNTDESKAELFFGIPE